ncbi:hypothetical protein CAPTEDRAFT_202283 [Capitella teleta]|uniref:Uncharacterized protein n=1 Tax=Capitella teleta TaxID=283909 RepID=R7TFU2_CAPTE|nr:hypothetical protein CAPTEDRAFT_202283 [Capitella teleta]|eukprot:ELT90406.1 hypothetical protein CAPTEDRAFT_202283 [Capitella teleta]
MLPPGGRSKNYDRKVSNCIINIEMNAAAQARVLQTKLKRHSDDITRAAAAIAIYAQEGNVAEMTNPNPKGKNDSKGEVSDQELSFISLDESQNQETSTSDVITLTPKN